MKSRDTVYNDGSGKRFFRDIPFSSCHALSIMVLLMALSSTVAVSFYAKRASLYHHRVVDDLTLKLMHERGEIDARDGHILTMAGEIDGMKENLLDLYAFEKKIRIIADLGSAPLSDYPLGMGGALPEDIDPSLRIQKEGEVLAREMAIQLRGISVAAEAEMGRLGFLYDILYDKRSVLESTPSICPTTGWNSSRFGKRISPFSGKKSVHKGYDIANYVGTPVVAPANGVVTFAGKRGSMGIMVTLDHGHGMVTRYGHLSKSLKKKGDQVSRGERIALMGNTGRSTGPHLHYEVRVNGIPVNPAKYILD